MLPNPKEEDAGGNGDRRQMPPGFQHGTPRPEQHHINAASSLTSRKHHTHTQTHTHTHISTSKTKRKKIQARTKQLTT